MDREVLDFVVKKTHELMDAASCSSEAKAAAQVWLDAVGTDREAAETCRQISVALSINSRIISLVRKKLLFSSIG